MKFLGANWRTSLSAFGASICSLLTILAALPYELGSVATIIPPAWKAKIAIAGAISTALLKIVNGIVQKDKNVVGGTVQQTASGAVADTGTQTLVDETIKASLKSGEVVTAEQKAGALS